LFFLSFVRQQLIDEFFGTKQIALLVRFASTDISPKNSPLSKVFLVQKLLRLRFGKKVNESVNNVMHSLRARFKRPKKFCLILAGFMFA
jgi:hypothetical protein